MSFFTALLIVLKFAFLAGVVITSICGAILAGLVILSLFVDTDRS
jgi:hypothetical protein